MNKSVRKLDSIDGTVTQICANSYSYIPTPLAFICQPALTFRCTVCKNKIILPTPGKNGIDGTVQWLFHAIQIQVSRKQINHSVIFAWGCFLSLMLAQNWKSVNITNVSLQNRPRPRFYTNHKSPRPTSPEASFSSLHDLACASVFFRSEWTLPACHPKV
jgi:hypothetical protein